MEQVLKETTCISALKLNKGSHIRIECRKMIIYKRKNEHLIQLIAKCNAVSNLILLWGLMLDIFFINLKQRLSVNLYYEDRSWTIEIKLLLLEIRTI